MREEIVNICQDLMKFRTTADRSEEIEKCLDYIKNYFEGFVVKEYEHNGKKSLIISFKETKKPKIFLHGHIDVVEGKDEQFLPVVTNDRIIGRGSADMKAGVACLMMAMQELKSEKPNVALMIVSDEEIGGYDGMKYLLEEGYRADLWITAEPNKIDEKKLDIIYKHKGAILADIKAKGKSAHASRPWEGESAVDNLIKHYEQIKKILQYNPKDTWTNTVNITTLDSENIDNKVPNWASAVLDIRYNDLCNPLDLIENIKSLAEVNIKRFEPMLVTNTENELILTLKSFITDEIGNCEFITTTGGTDARHSSAVGDPSIVWGPYGEHLHADAENASIPSMESYTKILIKFLQEAAN